MAGAVFVIKAEGQGLEMGKQVLADIRLHQHAEDMAPVADHVLQRGPQQVGGNQHGDHGEKGLVAALGDQLVHAHPGHVGEQQVDAGDHQCAGHIQDEKSHMGPEIAEKDAQKALVMEVAGTHGGSSVFYFIIASHCTISGFQMQRGHSLIFSSKKRPVPPRKKIIAPLHKKASGGAQCGWRGSPPEQAAARAAG